MEPNKDTVNGGAAAQFNQETIAEFQVLTAGFAEFGCLRAVVNVITKAAPMVFMVWPRFSPQRSFDSVNSLIRQSRPLHLRSSTTASPLGPI
jgi:hypothetical protein